MSVPRPIAIAHIQSGSVSIAIALPHRDAPLEIIALERTDLSFEDRTPAATIAALGNQIEQTGKKALEAYAASKKSHGLVVRSYAIMSAPWTQSQTIRTISTFDTDTLITEDMVGALAKKALQESTEINAANLLEANVVRIELNGYPTMHPAGKKAHKLLVSSLISDCSPEIRTVVQENLQKLFAGPVIFRSQLRAMLSVTAAIPQLPEDYCLVEIARENTTIANIHTGLSMGHATAAEGTVSIIKRIAGDGLPEEAVALLQMIADDQCTSTACDAMRESMVRAEPELVRIFGEAMATLTTSRYLPPTLMLLCENNLTSWLTGLFSRIDFTQFTTTTQPFEVIVLDSSALHTFITPSPGIVIDTRFGLASALVHIEEKNA